MLSTILASLTIVLVPIWGILWNSGLRCGTYGGVYSPSESTIYLCSDYQEFYKHHEIGHHIWFKFLTQKQRDDYTKLYERDLKKGKFYRDYGRTSAIEDFAENYAVIVSNKKHNNTRLPFIRKILKNIK